MKKRGSKVLCPVEPIQRKNRIEQDTEQFRPVSLLLIVMQIET